MDAARKVLKIVSELIQAGITLLSVNGEAIGQKGAFP